jgi:hypothetical protein
VRVTGRVVVWQRRWYSVTCFVSRRVVVWQRRWYVVSMRLTGCGTVTCTSCGGCHSDRVTVSGTIAVRHSRPSAVCR